MMGVVTEPTDDEGLLLDAHLAAHGWAAVTVTHGSVSTLEEAELVLEGLEALAEESGPVEVRTGGAEFSTFVFNGHDAEASAERFVERVQALGQPRWSVARGRYPRQP